MRLLLCALMLPATLLTYAQSDFGQRSVRYGLGVAGIDGSIGTTYAVEHRLAATIEYDDVIFDAEITSTRFNGLAGSPFYYSGTMYFGHRLLPGFSMFVGPTFFNRVDISEGLFGLSAKTLLTITRTRNLSFNIQTGIHYSGQFVIWSGGIACTYHLP